MKWEVDSNALISYEYKEEIILSTFEHLTGKKIKSIPGKRWNIITVRDRGHIRLYDETFIKGEKYKYRSNIYLCEHVDNKGSALLNKLGKNMVVKTAKLPLIEGWEIA